MGLLNFVGKLLNKNNPNCCNNLLELSTVISRVANGTQFSVKYERREDGFESLRLYEQTYYKNDPLKPHKSPKEIGYILKSKYDDGWEVESTEVEENAIGDPPYLYNVNGTLCSGIDWVIHCFTKPLFDAGFKFNP